MAKTLRLILGDQLNYRHSWFQEADDQISYTLMEILPETAYVTHHIQKVIGFFGAMRAFEEFLRENNHRVVYFRLNDEHNRQSFEENLRHLIEDESFERFEYLLPDEYRLDQQLAEFAQELSVESAACDSEHFLCERFEVREFFKNRKTYVLESFYRHIRKKHDILMDGDEPLTGRWNYDEENRRALAEDAEVPEALLFRHDVSELVDMLEEMEVNSIGNIDPPNFPWPLNRSEALQALDHFLENRLEKFGTYQDAMASDRPFLYHSRLSFALNTKMLHPLEVVEKTLDYWENHRSAIDIAQVEGFVRQIIGWREFMRGIYWDKMPDYEELNFFGHKDKLPDFYWSGDTKMNCLRQAVKQSLDHAYAHHIQRLMVTGNFALLLGVDPDEVDEWYLGIYIDAVQWVEITNTRGMSQFADGGIVGTKPYISSANYINKMSDYCQSCHYYRSKRHGERACPFNSLYWDFYDRHREKLENNHRVAFMYRTLSKMDEEEIKAIRRQAAHYRKHADEL